MKTSENSLEKSKSIKAFKRDLVKKLPFSPNSGATQNELLSKHLRVLLVDYFTWVIRTISVRPREVIVLPEVTHDNRYPHTKDRIAEIIKKANNGEDLNPYLSHKVRSKGYIAGKNSRSQDEDIILNQKGLHHLHLGGFDEKCNIKRTDEVIMIRADSQDFYVLGIFDHDIFDSDENIRIRNFNTVQSYRTVSPRDHGDKPRLHQIYKNFIEKDMLPNTSYMANPIMASGHPMHVIQMAMYYYEVIHSLDPLINTNDWQNKIYNEYSLIKPNNNKLRWVLEHSDLGLLDKNNVFLQLCFSGL